MNIAVVTRHPHHVGGVETYLEQVLPQLIQRGHRVALWHEAPLRANAEPVVSSIPLFHLDPSGAADSTSISSWSPDVVFLHGVSDVSSERALGGTAPVVVFLHDYAGACISGTKTHGFPAPAVCSHPLGPGCLVRYFPRHCGGWSPVTMVTSYAAERRRQMLLRRCTAVATLSEHMRRECLGQGVAADRVVHLPAFVPSSVRTGCPTPRRGDTHNSSHLLFLGRMDRLKGADLLAEALGLIAPRHRLATRVTFAGDGRDRDRVERWTARLADGPAVTFAGWLGPAARAAVLASADLLVVPSVWPEPLGLVGLEAATAGVPAVAFDVGGIPEWLADGTTGRLIRGTPTPAALARGIEDCLSDRDRLASWGVAARERAGRLSLAAHVDRLDELLRSACTSHDSVTRATRSH